MSGIILTGKSKDGSDARQPTGAFLSKNGEIWSNMPITKEQKAYVKITDYCSDNHLSFNDLYKKIKSGHKVELPKSVISWFINEVKQWKNFN